MSARRKPAPARTVPDVTHHDESSDPALRPGPACGTQAAIDRIKAKRPDLAEMVQGAINDPNVSQAAAATFLTKHGGKSIKAAAVGYHRRRGTVYGCSCNV